MSKIKLRLSIFIVLLNTMACGYSQGDASLSSLAQSDSLSPLEKFQNTLQGTWSRPCLFDANNGYYKEALAFAGLDGSFAIVAKDFFYSDANCTALTLIKTQSLTVLDINANGSGWTYSATVAAQSYAPQTAQSAALLNSAHTCGNTQWVAGLTIDTTNSGCNSTGTFMDTLYLTNGSLFRALDEVTNPNVISGTIPQGSPYTRQF